MFCVKVCPETSKLLQEVAFKNGFKWGDKGMVIQYTDYLYLSLWTDNTICYSDRVDDEDVVLDICTAIKRLKDGKRTLYLDSATVTIDNNLRKINFDSNSITFEDFNKIRTLIG